MELNKPKKCEQVTSRMHEIYDKCAPTVKSCIARLLFLLLYSDKKYSCQNIKEEKSGLAMRE